MLYELNGPAGVGRTWPQGVGGLSSDGRLVCLSHTEHGDILHTALRVLDADTGATVADLGDEGRNLDPGGVVADPGRSPARRARASASAFERPAIWDLDTDDRRDIDVDLPGAAFPVDWWPDGSALLLRHEHHGRAQLYRLRRRAPARSKLVADPHGDIGDAAVRPDGEVWFEASDGVRPTRILAGDGREVLANPDEPAPAGRPFRSVFVANPHGEEIQSFVVTPEGDGPFPTVLSVHGGPEWHERDAFDPEVQAFVDAGYAVVLVNYRGSTGYGSPFREALIGNVCFTETEDLLASLDALVAEGVVDPGARVLARLVLGRLPRLLQRRACIPNAGGPCSLGSRPGTSSRPTGPPRPSSRRGTTPSTAGAPTTSPTPTGGATR